MTSPRRLLLLAVLIAACAVLPVSASYAGDQPLETGYSGELEGGYIFTLGNSSYSGVLGPGDRYSVEFECDPPAGSEVRYVRIYLYWTWSRLDQDAIYPECTLSLSGAGSLPRSDRWVDSKGFAGKNDFFSGVDAYQVPATGAVSPHCSVTVENTAADNRTFAIQGAGLLLVYEEPGSPAGMIWVKEGCDMLYSSYGISPEMATSRIDFEGDLPPGKVAGATLELVAPSGGYTRSDQQGINALLFNREEEGRLPSFIEAIIESLFPGYNGKEWIDAFDADEVRQVGIDRREVAQYLRDSGNVACVRDQGDYLLLSNAVLWVETEA